LRKDDEISSTEKLLDIIRHGTDDPPGGSGTPVVAADDEPPPAPKTLFSFSKNKITAGLIFARKSVNVLVLDQEAENQWKLVNFASVEDKPGVDRGSIEFKRHLRSSLIHLIGGQHKEVDIWAAVPSDRVEMRHLAIPKVPDDQVANAVFWNFSKLVQINERDFIFDYSILDEIEEDKKKKLRVAAYAAPKKDIGELKSLLSETGFSPKGISIIPFAVQNMFRTGFIDTPTSHICTLFIGREWSRIDIFAEGDLVLSRVVKTGINSIVEEIRSGFSMDLDDAEATFNHLIGNTRRPGESGEANRDTREEKIFDAVMPVLERLVRQVDRTIGHFSLTFGSEGITDVFLSGKVTGNIKLTERIESLMPYSIQPVDPFSSDKLATGDIRIPESAFEKDLFLPAMGLALSGNTRTPNFLFTFRDKNTLASITKINRTVFAIFILIIILLSGLFYWQEVRALKKKNTIRILREELASYSPQVDLDLLRNITAKTISNQHRETRVAGRYFQLAMFKELSELVPDNIDLLSVKADFGTGHKGNKKKKKMILIEGIVDDLPSERETTLAIFMIKLNESPIFGNQSEMMTKRIEQFQGKEVLRFSTRMELING